MTTRKRWIVGRTVTGERLGEFDTLDEVYSFQATLDQTALVAGEFYLDDMDMGEDA